MIKLILEESQLCDKDLFLSAIREHITKHQDPSVEEHINYVILNEKVKQASSLFDDLMVTQKTIQSLKNHPLVLSSFFTGLKENYNKMYYSFTVMGRYKIDNINTLINEAIIGASNEQE